MYLCFFLCLYVLFVINTKKLKFNGAGQKLQKYYTPSHCLNINVMLSNITFLSFLQLLLQSDIVGPNNEGDI